MNIDKGTETFTNIDRKALAQFVDLLSSVNERVSRSKVESRNNKKITTSIDKLVLHLPRPVNLSFIREKCEKLNIPYACKYLRDKKLYFIIKFKTQEIQLYLGHPNNTEIIKVYLNPSQNDYYYKSESNLILIFGPIVLDSKIYRIDYAFDIFMRTSEVLSGLDVKGKIVNHEYIKNSSKTGMIIGTGNDKVIIYDKAKKERVNYPWTRGERQISSSKLIKKHLGTDRFGDLRYKLPEILDFNPLSIISLNHISFVNEAHLTDVQKDKLKELKTLIKHEGYFLARKKLNKNNNFRRDYQNLFILTPYEYELKDAFKEDITCHFKEVYQ